MTRHQRKSRLRLTACLLPVLPLLLAAGCNLPEPDGSSPSAAGNGGRTEGGGGGLSGSGRSGAGGFTTGGTNAGNGGLVSGGSGGATGGSTGGVGGLRTGGTGASGGDLMNGGTSGAAGALAAGGASGGSDGLATGGTGAGTGGLGTAGANAGRGGAGAAGGSSGTAGTGSGENPVFHVFLLMGQSNMAGVATSEPSDRNTDERLKVLGGCNQPAGQWNVANPPLSDCPGEKGWNLSNSVDPGIWFGKTLLEKLPPGDTIGLVGTAESGESINTFISGGSHHQMILRKIAEAKMAENARFAGVIFHQGESDSGQSTWPAKVVQLYDEVKEAFGVDYDVPFILGELPQGGCCAGHNALVHQAADMLPMGYWISQEGTRVMDDYHFDHASVVLMGQRYGETMLEALNW